MKYKILSVVVLVCVMLMLGSCSSFSFSAGSGRRYEYKSGPPPHAPAHGYRHRHHGVELVYDSECGIYVVIGFPNHYYFKDRYYRLRETRWEISVNLDGPWEFVSYYELPKGVEKKSKASGKSKEHPGLGISKD